MASEVAVSVYDFNKLMKEHEANTRIIDRIKNKVSKPIDNLENAVPLFEQLEASPD